MALKDSVAHARTHVVFPQRTNQPLLAPIGLSGRNGQGGVKSREVETQDCFRIMLLSLPMFRFVSFPTISPL